MGNAYVEGWLYVPFDQVAAPEVLRKMLTVLPRQLSQFQEEKKPIPVYSDAVDGHIGVPIDWGLRKLPSSMVIDDRTTLGGPFVARRRPDPNHPNAAPGQEKFMLDLRAAMVANHSVLAIAPTGSGKTVTALDTAAHFGRSTVVMVPLENIMGQWHDEAKLHLGLTDDEIGIIQGDKCQYDRPLVLCMMKSLSMREYPPECYNAFGIAVWDEVHRTGAPMLSQTLGKFKAASKLALTATADRKDEACRVYKLYFGGASVESEQEGMPCEYRVLDHRSHIKLWGEDHGARVKCLTMDKLRNEKIMGLIASEYDNGANMLIIGESIDHLEELAAGVRLMGVPDNEIGQFTGQFTDPATGKRTKVGASYLAWCKEKPALIFATYGMMKEAVNIPRLDRGIDVTPRSDAIQVIGRIRRPVLGKRKPIWYTIADRISPSFMRYFKSRLKELRSDPNVEIIDVNGSQQSKPRND